MNIPSESLEDFLASLPSLPDKKHVFSGRPNFDLSMTTCSFDSSVEEDIAPKREIKTLSYSPSPKDSSSSSSRHKRAQRSLRSSSHNNNSKRLSRTINTTMDGPKLKNDATSSDANGLPVRKETEKDSSLEKDTNMDLDITTPSKRSTEDKVQIEEGIQLLEQAALQHKPRIYPLQKHDWEDEAQEEKVQEACTNTHHYPSQHQDASQQQIEQLQKELDAATRTVAELKVRLAEEQTKNDVLRLRMTRAENVNKAQQALNHEMAVRIKMKGRVSVSQKTSNGDAASKARIVRASAVAAAATVASQAQYLAHKLMLDNLYSTSITSAVRKDNDDNNKISIHKYDTHVTASD